MVFTLPVGASPKYNQANQNIQFSGGKNKSKQKTGQPSSPPSEAPSDLAMLKAPSTAQTSEIEVAESEQSTGTPPAIIPVFPEQETSVRGANAAQADRFDSHRPEIAKSEIADSEITEAEIAFVEKPDGHEYIQSLKQQERQEMEAIGRRFAAPGRALNAVENKTKALSRKLMGQTRELASSTGKALCRNAAKAFRKAAKVLESWE